MPDWTVLKLWMASCWKVSWNVDPLELSVPLRAALLDELDVAAPLPLVDGGEDEELDEEHAARDSAVATTTAPIVLTCCLRPSCISRTPYWFSMFPRPRQQPPAGQHANRGVRVQSAGSDETCGQTNSGQTGARRLTSGVLNRHPERAWPGSPETPGRRGVQLLPSLWPPAPRNPLTGTTLAGSQFTYMTSSGRLAVPLLFNFCSPEVNINGGGSRALPAVLRSKDE